MITRVLPQLLLAALLAGALLVPTASPAAEAPATTTETQTVPVVPTETAPPSSSSEAPPPTSTTTPQTPPATPPRVGSGHAQGTSPAHAPHPKRGAARTPATKRPTPSQGAGGKAAPLPSTLTPKLPMSLAGPILGIPSFFVESFRVPPFLLPIYQAAGAAYDVPWQLLAAINEVESDYGRDLSVSPHGEL